MKKKLVILTALIVAAGLFIPHATDILGKDTSAPRLGVWVTVFTPEKVLYSKANADRLIDTCKKTGITDIYLQVYRSDKAYYDSDLTDRSAYEDILSEAGEDPINHLLRKAKANNIKVHAWINVLSIAQNTGANVLSKMGDAALTLDQYGRTSMQKGNKDALDKYFIRENQLFLEPGSPAVREYLAGIAGEIARKYPGFSGMHLDYIRYPAVVPFTPGSRFSSHGITYGYNDINLEAFKNSSGLDARKMDGARESFRAWDDWRRDRVTLLVKEVSGCVRAAAPGWKISCTIVPSIERTYLVTLQDWTKWLGEGYVDYVVAMNYTDDTKLMKMNSRSILMPAETGKVYIGVGAYLIKDRPETLKEQLEYLRKLSPGGVVIFSYDEVAASPDLQKFLANRFRS